MIARNRFEPLTTPATKRSAMVVTTTPMVIVRRVARLRAMALRDIPIVLQCA